MRENRWSVAQQYEKEWWARRIDAVDFDFYRAYADELQHKFNTLLKIDLNTSILEIGSGAGGIVTFLNSNDRHAIDPLEDFYGSVPEFLKQRDPAVSYQMAKAEELPFDAERFDLLICDNVLDHCDNIETVFGEMARVMRPGAVLFLRLNVYTPWGRLVRLFVEKLKIDPGHPYTFTRRSIKNYFAANNFSLVQHEETGFLHAWLKEIRSFKLKEMIKALTFSSQNKSIFILQKQLKNGHI